MLSTGTVMGVVALVNQTTGSFGGRNVTILSAVAAGLGLEGGVVAWLVRDRLPLRKEPRPITWRWISVTLLAIVGASAVIGYFVLGTLGAVVTSIAIGVSAALGAIRAKRDLDLRAARQDEV